MSLKHFAALLLSAALALCLLAACGGTSESTASSEAVPSSQTEASASGLLPSDEENTLTFTDPAKAFESSLGWGPGTAGTSLKSVIAAADLMEWAEDNNLAHQSRSAAESQVEKWFDSLTETQQENFAEAWALIKEDAATLLTDKDSMSGRIEDAGLDAKKLPGCTQENWDVLQEIVDGIVPETVQ